MVWDLREAEEEEEGRDAKGHGDQEPGKDGAISLFRQDHTKDTAENIAEKESCPSHVEMESYWYCWVEGTTGSRWSGS